MIFAKYTAATPPAAAAPPSAPRGDYAARKERERRRQRELSRVERDIAALPAVADPARRAAADASLLTFLLTYFRHRFPLAFGPAQHRLITRLEEVILRGGNRAFALPRKFGKSTITECAVLWAILTGRRRFAVLVGAAQEAADEMRDSLKAECETNELLAADYPVLYPILCLQGIAQRAKGQTYRGRRTHLRWTGRKLVFPTLPEEPAAAAVLVCVGLTGRIRGMRHTCPDGRVLRPDIAFLDDIQTDESARSDAQCTTRLKIVRKAILGLAGPNRRLAAVAALTIIEPNDAANQLLDRKLWPAWQGETSQTILAWPSDREWWDRYADLYRADLQAGGDGADAHALYLRERERADAGAALAWEGRVEPGDASAVETAMRLWIEDPEGFAAECQNDPRAASADESELLPAREIARKLSGLPRGKVPLACSVLTAYIDVQHTLLYWLVAAWDPATFTGAVLDYGAHPDQKRSYWKLRQVRRTLQSAHHTTNTQAAVLAGLQTLTAALLTRDFLREDGQPFRVARVLIDSRDGAVTDQVAAVCRQSPHRAALLPAQGRAFGPADKPMAEYRRREGEQIGDHWLIAPLGKRMVRTASLDANYWKRFVHLRLRQAAGEPGALTLFGRAQDTEHVLLAEHCHAETMQLLTDQKTRRTVPVFKVKPARPDNHLFDCLAGAAAAASIAGCRLAGTAGLTPRRRRRAHVATL